MHDPGPFWLKPHGQGESADTGDFCSLCFRFLSLFPPFSAFPMAAIGEPYRPGGYAGNDDSLLIGHLGPFREILRGTAIHQKWLPPFREVYSVRPQTLATGILVRPRALATGIRFPDDHIELFNFEPTGSKIKESMTFGMNATSFAHSGRCTTYVQLMTLSSVNS